MTRAFTTTVSGAVLESIVSKPVQLRRLVGRGAFQRGVRVRDRVVTERGPSSLSVLDR
jgi:hypothetical protein